MTLFGMQIFEVLFIPNHNILISAWETNVDNWPQHIWSISFKTHSIIVLGKYQNGSQSFQMISIANNDQYQETYLYSLNATRFNICWLWLFSDGNLRDKVEALDSTLFYLSQLETNLHNDINITKRAANKALEDITTAEDSKYKQVSTA